MSTNLEEKRRKIGYHVARRANLELETILNSFWRTKGRYLSLEDLELFEKLIDMDDLDLLEIILGKKPLPSSCFEDLLMSIRASWKDSLKNFKI